MTDSEHTTTLPVSRRHLLAGALAVTAPNVAGALPTSLPVAALPVFQVGDVGADAAIHAAFRRWVAQRSTLSAKWAAGTHAYEELRIENDALEAIVAEISAMPADSSAAWAVKTYLLLLNWLGHERDDPFTVREPDPDPRCQDVYTVLTQSLLADAMACLPGPARA